MTCNEQSHFFLLKGRASFGLPAGPLPRRSLPRTCSIIPASQEFELARRRDPPCRAEARRLDRRRVKDWISGDDHIHLTRARQDDDVFLRWLEAEDSRVGNFLQLQRQMDAAVQYAFGPPAEARGPVTRSGRATNRAAISTGTSICSGGRELIRPLSVGAVYANSPDA